FCQRIVREAAPFLVNHGFCQVVCNWMQLRGHDWTERLSQWFHECGCDVSVLRGRSIPAMEYVMSWNQEESREPGFGQVFSEWMNYFEERGVDSVGIGVVTMRKREDGQSSFFAENAPPQIQGSMGEHIAEQFELRDFLAAHADPNQLAAARLELDPTAILHVEMAASPNGWMPNKTELTRTRGLGYRMEIDQWTAQMLPSCDGTRTLADILRVAAQQLSANPRDLAANSFPQLRQLIARGLVRPR
ncbi:MAG TPA: hypothetical protein VIY86_07830, partial [Pirellulaceae bacterium]